MTETAVRERPILFSAHMVRAILAGTKTQTRRVVTNATSTGNIPASLLALGDPRTFVDRGFDGAHTQYLHAPLDIEAVQRRYGFAAAGDVDETVVERLFCRYEVGSRLWVREAWHGLEIGDQTAVAYRADMPPGSERYDRWSSPIHMPRWASRITLEVTGVRVERLQEISTHDIAAEGVNLSNNHRGARNEFRDRWDALNAARGYPWESNPFVWVLAFRRI